MLVLGSLLESWSHLIVAIWNITTKLKMDEVVALSLYKYIHRETFESNKEALAVCGRLKEKSNNKDKKDKRDRLNSCDRSKYPRNSKLKC